MRKNFELIKHRQLSIGLGVAAVVLFVTALYIWTSQAEAPENDMSPDTDSISDIEEPGQEDHQYAETFIGLGESDAAAKAEQDGYSYRIVARDSEQFPVTMDYNPKRVNLTIEDGVVTRAALG
jgi:hypothetical protein